MVSLFVLVSFLGLFAYLNKNRKFPYLLVSGASFGLAQLTKSTSISLVVVVALMLFFEMFKNKTAPFRSKLQDVVMIGSVWFGMAVLVYFIFWPGMWVAPAKMLEGVYGNAFSYAFQGARLDVTQELVPSTFGVITRFDAFSQYIQYWVSSTTPLTWFGLLFCIPLFFARDIKIAPRQMKLLIAYLAMLGFSIIAMFAIAQGRNDARYIMSAYISFDVIAGIGWGYALMRLQPRFQLFTHKFAVPTLVVILILIQIGFGLPYAPYYFTYKGPFASRPATYGYGEGMAQAADYLAAKPDAKNIRAYVYNGMGTFSFFFPGQTTVFKRVYLIDNDFATIIQDMHHSDYLVLYPVVRELQPETEKILKPLEAVMPEKVIYINGVEYIRIYKISDIPESVYAELGK